MPDNLDTPLEKRLRGLCHCEDDETCEMCEAADALSAATERERGLREALEWIADANVSGDKMASVASAALAEHKGTPRG
jgi:hypothetical protein